MDAETVRVVPLKLLAQKFFFEIISNHKHYNNEEQQ
jgi:hypothetical protein